MRASEHEWGAREGVPAPEEEEEKKPILLLSPIFSHLLDKGRPLARRPGRLGGRLGLLVRQDLPEAGAGG